MGGQPGTVKITRLNFSTNPRLVGAEPDYLITDKHVLASGRFIHPLDLERQHRVIVLGRALVDELWPGNDDSFFPLGESVRINGWNFTVIGVFDRYMDSRQKKEKELGLDKAREARRKERGTAKQRPSRNSGGYQWKNTVAAIPLSTMQAIFKSSNVVNNVDQGPDIKLSRLTIQVVDPRQLDSALQQIRNVLTMTHRGIRDFGFETREDMIESIDRSVTATRLSGGLIAGLSLLVGGLGITNIMLASISERIREIGIRRAVGARASDIFIQILMESFVLAMIGGFFGLIAGWGMTELLKVISPVENNPIIESSSILISLAFAMLVGILAGLYPAFQASQLSPIQALRYE
jgi:putative ABC transport system permease protein